jgi:hypothetical protein
LWLISFKYVFFFKELAFSYASIKTVSFHLNSN